MLVDLQQLFPRATESTLTEALREVRSSSTTVGIVAFVASLWVATSFWGALDTAFCRIYGVPCRSWVRQKLFGLGMLGLVLLFFAATVAVPAVQSLLFARSGDLPFGLSGRDALWAITLGAGLVVNFVARDDLPHRAELRRRRGTACGRERSARRSRSSASTTASRSTSRTSRPSAACARRSCSS